jgi:hypothetical protein
MDDLNWVQWPAMLVTLLAAWLVGSISKRKIGFWVFLSSNVLWVIWGLYNSAYALILLQFGLAQLIFEAQEKMSLK